MSNKQWQNVWKRIDTTLFDKDVFYITDEINYNYVKALLPNRAKTLEVGAGSARLSCFLAQDNYETVCVDYSPEALRVAKNNYRLLDIQGTFVLGEAHNLPFKGNSFDVVMSTGLLEHFRDPKPIVIEMVRVLKKGGLFYSDIVPDKFSLLRAFSFCHKAKLKIQGEEDIFEGKFIKAGIIELLSTSGLKNIKAFPAGIFPPLIPILSRLKTGRRIHSKLVYEFKTLWPRLDDTIWAEWLGFYYFCYGYKSED